ncbi:MAG: phosphoribosyl-AMP cyclohydrolase [Alphaproteobacteria bacterium GM7ARS4]|nr:phosphoribosyl-AMP cyclohydrolase [Alphaproteobacteria bacterium GM7ARS4]
MTNGTPYLHTMTQPIHFNKDGLIPAIAVDAHTKDVLMMAWMNEQALDLTMQTGYVHYWSRSRKQIWRKGETSQHTQHLERITLDCDGDTLLLHVTQKGVACHTGRPSCFYRLWNKTDKTWKNTCEPLIDPRGVYKRKDDR